MKENISRRSFLVFSLFWCVNFIVYRYYDLGYFETNIYTEIYVAVYVAFVGFSFFVFSKSLIKNGFLSSKNQVFVPKNKYRDYLLGIGFIYLCSKSFIFMKFAIAYGAIGLRDAAVYGGDSGHGAIITGGVDLFFMSFVINSIVLYLIAVVSSPLIKLSNKRLFVYLLFIFMYSLITFSRAGFYFLALSLIFSQYIFNGRLTFDSFKVNFSIVILVSFVFISSMYRDGQITFFQVIEHYVINYNVLNFAILNEHINNDFSTVNDGVLTSGAFTFHGVLRFVNAVLGMLGNEYKILDSEFISLDKAEFINVGVYSSGFPIMVNSHYNPIFDIVADFGFWGLLIFPPLIGFFWALTYSQLIRSNSNSKLYFNLVLFNVVFLHGIVFSLYSNRFSSPSFTIVIVCLFVYRFLLVNLRKEVV